MHVTLRISYILYVHLVMGNQILLRKTATIFQKNVHWKMQAGVYSGGAEEFCNFPNKICYRLKAHF